MTILQNTTSSMYFNLSNMLCYVLKSLLGASKYFYLYDVSDIVNTYVSYQAAQD